MSDQRPVYVNLPLTGDDPELAAIGAIVQLLERHDFRGEGNALCPLVSAQKERIARYLFNRYAPEEYSALS